MKLTKRISQGETIPPFYGIAWHEWYADRAVCLPVPLNIVAGLLRSLWAFLQHGHRNVYANPRDAYRQGLRDGANPPHAGRDGQHDPRHKESP